MLKFKTNYLNPELNEQKIIDQYQNEVNSIDQQFKQKQLPGIEMTGWIDLIANYDEKELALMKKKANQWKKHELKYIVIVGIGGSYLGVRAAIEMINGLYQNNPEIIYIHNISSTYIKSVLKKIGSEKFGLIVISKSGTTLEPAIGFRIFRKLLEKNMLKNNTKDLIVAITDEHKGVLHDFARQNGYTMFKVPDNIGGRFSTLTAVGLFPMLVCGIKVDDVLKGAKQALSDTSSTDLKKNSAYLYACYRHYFFHHANLKIENMVFYDPHLAFIGEQYKQMFGESEGKDNKGLYPATSLFTTDLHSMGQFFQEGNKCFFETTLLINEPKKDYKLAIKDNHDGLKYLDQWSLDQVNKQAFHGTIKAHSELGQVPNLLIELDQSDAYHYGYWYFWTCQVVKMNCYLTKVNPFNQPGVEAYKNNMFKLLKK